MEKKPSIELSSDSKQIRPDTQLRDDDDVVAVENSKLQEASEPDFSHIDEAKTLRKMDIRLLPVLTVLYLLSFLDRGYVPRVPSFKSTE